MKKNISLTLVLLTTSVTQLALAEFTPADPKPYVSNTLDITGAVKKSLSLTLDDLKKFPTQNVSDAAEHCLVDTDKVMAKNYRGILLRDLINKAEFNHVDAKAWKRAYIVAHATDDYQAVFSWNEIFNSVIGDAVIVVLAAQDKPLGDAEGKIALISGCDKRTGPRHVKWLTRIEVKL